VLSIVISTVAFFVATYYIKRWADDNDIPKGSREASASSF